MGQQPPYPVSSYFHPGQGQPPTSAPYGSAPWDPDPREAAARRPQTQGPIPYGTRPPEPLAAGPRPLAATGASPRHVIMAGGSMVALAALLITPNLGERQDATVNSFGCIKIEQNQALISRDQIRKLVATEPQAAKSTVQELLSTPYCVMSPAKTEAGITADREAYPLEFDPQTWLVVLYEGDRYLGYDFRFR